MADMTQFLQNAIHDPLSIVGFAVLLAIAGLLLWSRSGASWHRRLQPKQLLTANETEFFFRLCRALPAYRIFPQVAFAAFMTDDGKLSAKARWSLRAKFDRKIADFVVCEARSLRIVALIELDDCTHTAMADRQRDAITKAAGYRTFRFQSRQKPSTEELAGLFQYADAW